MGVLGVYRDAVILVNRTNRILNVRYDGEDIKLQPGENPGFPVIAVSFAKAQNPLMGSRHPNSPGKFISLVGVKNTKDDVTTIPQAVLDEADGELEVIDRKGKYWGRPMRQNVRLLNRGFDPEEAGVGGSYQDSNMALDAKLG
jgi:hypothetical protein